MALRLLENEIAKEADKERALAHELTEYQQKHAQLQVILDEINMTNTDQETLQSILLCTENPALRSAIYFRLAYIEKENGDLFNALHHFKLGFQNKETQVLYQKAIKEIEALEDRTLDSSDISFQDFHSKAETRYHQNRFDEAAVFCLKSLECLESLLKLSNKGKQVMTSTYFILMNIYRDQNDWINLDIVYKKLISTQDNSPKFKEKMREFITTIRDIHSKYEQKDESHAIKKIFFMRTHLFQEQVNDTLSINLKRLYSEIQRQRSPYTLTKAMASLSLIELYIGEKNIESVSREIKKMTETSCLPSFLIGWIYYRQGQVFNKNKQVHESLTAYDKALDCCSSLFEARHARNRLIQKNTKISTASPTSNHLRSTQALGFFALQQDDKAGEDTSARCVSSNSSDLG